MATYLPTTSLSPLYTFVQFSGTVSAFQTALNAAFPGLGIQCFADTTSGQTSWAVVVVGDVTVFAVAPNTWVGYNQGSWQRRSVAEMAGGINSVFTVYP